MKNRARIVSGLTALAALFLAPLAEASLTRVNPAERAIEAPALTLTEAARGPSEFSLFGGNELAPAAAEPERAPSFHPLAVVSLFSKDGADAPLVSADELSYPKTRYRIFGLLGTPILGELRGVTLELHWRSASFSCGLSSGTVGWLSQDPLGDKDSPNLYGFVGARPHEKTDPLGLWGIPEGFWNSVGSWIGNTPPITWARKKLGYLDTAAESVGTFAEQKARQSLEPSTGIDQATEETLRQAGVDPDSLRGALGGLQTGRALKQGAKPVVGDITRVGVTETSRQVLYAGVAKSAGALSEEARLRIRSNALRGASFEVRAQAAIRDLGERVIPSQFKRGAADRGFDFLSFSGSGNEAKLFMNEVKNESGRVGSRRFTAFGSNRMKTWQENLNVARQRIEDAGLDLETRETLLGQLDERRARIRVIGNPGTRFDPGVLNDVGKRTGFMVGEGPRVE